MDQSWEETETEGRRVVLIVPKQHVKTVKTALEQHDKLDRTTRILPETSTAQVRKSEDSTEKSRDEVVKGEGQGKHDEVFLDSMRIPTTIPYRAVDEIDKGGTALVKTTILKSIGIPTSLHGIIISHHTLALVPEPGEKNPLRKALFEVLSRLPSTALASLGLTPDRLVYAFPEGYSIYPPLLLLPHNAFSSPLWKALLTAYPVSAATLQPMWKHIAQTMGVTCIALNSPIPPTSSASEGNILRSPVNITPIYGNFGPTPTPQSISSPTKQDFEKALWVEACQNGIKQVWAPMYTMFSRGNIREKTRILNFPRPSSSTSTREEEEAVVDMYAGIGYFSLSYATMHYRPVLCFELNPWSVEGLRRGCLRNNFSHKIFSMENMWEWDDQETLDKYFYIFQMSNTHAVPLLKTQLPSLPPVRHVNLGLLPHSRLSWGEAVRLIDKEKGGWIHAHENVGSLEIEDRKVFVQREFQAHLIEADLEVGRDGGVRERNVEVKHVERVKMYAPGVVHCVFDVWIDGRGSNERA
jgi:tRNA wybutosine-synthesizing protein 2